jgi:hypothetical protein
MVSSHVIFSVPQPTKIQKKWAHASSATHTDEMRDSNFLLFPLSAFYSRVLAGIASVWEIKRGFCSKSWSLTKQPFVIRLTSAALYLWTFSLTAQILDGLESGHKLHFYSARLTFCHLITSDLTINSLLFFSHPHHTNLYIMEWEKRLWEIGILRSSLQVSLLH